MLRLCCVSAVRACSARRCSRPPAALAAGSSFGSSTLGVRMGFRLEGVFRAGCYKIAVEADGPQRTGADAQQVLDRGHAPEADPPEALAPEPRLDLEDGRGRQFAQPGGEN